MYELTRVEDVEKLFAIAHKKATKSHCLKKKVGAVLFGMDSGSILSSGCGEATVPCKECVRKVYEWSQDGCWSVHAELDAMFNYFGRDGYKENLYPSVMFTTHGPCDGCIKYLHRFRVSMVIYDIPYHNDYSKWNGKIVILPKTEFIKNYCISEDQLRLPI